MKLVYAAVFALLLSACGNAPGTTSQMSGEGSNASNLSATDSNGMGKNGTVSGATAGADDPATHSNDSANAQNANAKKVQSTH